MSEGSMPEPDRYSVEYVEIMDTGIDKDFQAALQEQLNEGSRMSWKLISVVHNPAQEGVLLIWDLQGFISG